MEININNITDLITFLESTNKISDSDAIKLTRFTTGLIVLFFFGDAKEQLISQLKFYNANFMHLPKHERPSLLCSRQKEFSIKDIYSS